jgi:hypothetical protein
MNCLDSVGLSPRASLSGIQEDLFTKPLSHAARSRGKKAL